MTLTNYISEAIINGRNHIYVNRKDRKDNLLKKLKSNFDKDSFIDYIESIGYDRVENRPKEGQYRYMIINNNDVLNQQVVSIGTLKDHSIAYVHFDKYSGKLVYMDSLDTVINTVDDLLSLL